MGRQRSFGLFIAGLMSILAVFGWSHAHASAPSISYAYQTTSSISNGSLVSLDLKHSNTVLAANSDNGSQLIGVVVANNDSRLAVGASSTTIQVATSGTASTFVSTLGGNINTGDQVGVSPFNGVGIKALPGSRVVGVAEGDFNSSSAGAATERVTNKSGQTSSIEVGYIPVKIVITTNATVLTANAPNGLQKFAQDITGHTVPTLRVVLSLVIAVGALITLITLLYASIYSSIISVGRNPLAKYTIFKALGSVIGLSIITAMVAGITIFLLLK